MTLLIEFWMRCFKELLKGGGLYKLWLGGLASFVVIGLVAYTRQASQGSSSANERPGFLGRLHREFYISRRSGGGGRHGGDFRPTFFMTQPQSRWCFLRGVAVAACNHVLALRRCRHGPSRSFLALDPGIGRFNWPTPCWRGT